MTGKIIVIVKTEEINGEDQTLKVTIGDGVYWWSGVILSPEMFPYYREGHYKRGRLFEILESYMIDNCIVIVSYPTEYSFIFVQTNLTQTNMILANKGKLIPDDDLRMIPIPGLFHERRKNKKKGTNLFLGFD